MTPLTRLVLVPLLVAAACGGGDEPARDLSSHVVDASDFEYANATYEVVAGATTSIELLNRGALEHTWTVLRAGADPGTADEVDQQQILFTLEADAAAAASGDFVAPEPGTYVIVCLIPGHLEAGMKASLVSRPPAS